MKSKYNGYTFPLSEKVTRQKVCFTNRYGIRLCGDLYLPERASGRLPAVAVCGPFGAVKEQASGLYADKLASRGFAALAFDPSFIGESGGSVRNVASPDINTEDFSAAVDFLSVQEGIDPEKIAILGICGFGGDGHQCRSHGYPYQGNRHIYHVRYVPYQCQGLLRWKRQRICPL